MHPRLFNLLMTEVRSQRRDVADLERLLVGLGRPARPALSGAEGPSAIEG